MFRRFILVVTAMFFLACGAAFAEYSRGNYVGDAPPLLPGKVRAEIVRDASQLVGGPAAEGRVGDFKIFNNKVAFIVCGARMSSGYSPFGGMVEDAGRLHRDDKGFYWRNMMGDVYEVFFKGADSLFGARLFAATGAEIIKDGSDGEAIIRVTGRDAEFPIRREFLQRASSKLKTAITIDYILRPDTTALEVKTTIKNESDSGGVFSIGMVFMLGDGMDILFSDYGLEWEKARGTYVAMLAAEGMGASYGWYVPETGLQINERITSLTITTAGKMKAPAGGTAEHTYYMIVGDGDVASVYDEKYKLEKREDIGWIEGRVVERGTGKAVPDMEIHALSPMGNYRYQAVSKHDGSFRMVSRPEEYNLQAASWERDDPAPVPVQVEIGRTKSVVIEVDPPARVEYDITDVSGAPIPARISFKRVSGKPIVMDDLKLFRNPYGGGFYKNFYTEPDGKGSVEVRPGVYEIYVSRGLEYEYVSMKMELHAGETAKMQAVLAHVIDTTGYMSGDFHIHSRPSPDSDDAVEDKVSGAAGLGLEVPIATDHDRLTDYKPYIQKLGLEKFVNSIVGDELTTVRLGHFNGFPLTFDLNKRNEGAPDWYGLSGPEIFKAFRDDPVEKTVIQINHGRDVGGGYFDFTGYDPATGMANDKENFSLDFDAMEVLNGRGYDKMKHTLPDWYSLLNRGKRMTGVGNSDCHTVFELNLGYPRNYVRLSTDNPPDMNEKEFIDAVLAQKISVNGGAFIRADVNGKAGPGEIVTDTDGSIDLNVNSSSPSWVKTDTLTIVANGVDVKTVDIKRPSENSALPFIDTFNLPVTTDTWFIVRVEGAADMFPVYPGSHPVSFTNPIYVDADGNGVFDPPMKFGN